MEHSRKELRELDCSNLSKDWKNWKRDFLVYMIANDKNKETEAKKIATFLWLIGTKGANVYSTLFTNDGTENSLLGTLTEMREEPEANGVAVHFVEHVREQRTLIEVLEKFDQHCLPQKNVTMESYKFNGMVQKEQQTFNEFLTELRVQIENCDFKCACGASYEERMLRDRVITGVYDKKLQLKLLDGRDEKLDRVIDLCKIFESANVNKEILDSKKQVINALSSDNSNNHIPDTVNVINRHFCFNCGGDWKPDHKDKCPARDFICKCGKKGHFQRMCRKKKSKSGMEERKHLSNINWANTSGTKINTCKQFRNALINSVDKFCRINSIGKRVNQWTKAYQLENEIVNFKLDSGSDANCIPINLIKKLKIKMSYKKNDFPVFDYSNNKLKIYGIVKLKLVDLKTKLENSIIFLVVNKAFEPILGLAACIDLGLIGRMDVESVVLSEQKEEFLKKNADVFTGLGKIPGQISINLKNDAKPVIHYRKRFPETIIKKLKSKLESMTQDGIISPVSKPTDWVNNIQIVEKTNGSLRICLDPKPLNSCIKREHFLIPTLDSFTSELCNKRVFSVLDCSNGFWQLELDNKSSELTTFMTPFGRYKFNRLPFGLNSAPEIFQKKMVQIFGDVPGVIVYFDDIAIAATDEIEHDRILSTVLERARLNNVKFNSDKIQYRKSEVKFMGHMFSAGTIKPADKYKSAILDIKRPTDKHGVMRLLGIFKYLARFIPNLSKLTAELRRLTGKDSKFEWNEKHDLELENLLKIITSEPILVAYDPEKPVTIQTDASKDGLGSVLIQDGHPVAFVSRTLSKSEQKWAQIEKELLSIVFACQRFHYFVYGREFTVESDHKPLEVLIKRDIDDVTPRLQRMFMALLKYPQLEIVYKPGKNMLVADCLSRAQLSEVAESNELSGVIHSVTKRVCVSEENYDYYKKILEGDEEYKRVSKFVESGWPGFHHLSDISKQFYKFKSELHFENDLLFRNHRLVIPTKLQRKIINWIHEPHLGIEKTLSRARMLYYWPGMNSQIKEVIASCNICEKFKRNSQKEPLNQERNPEYPYEFVSMDLFEYAGRDFIAIIDAYSNYLTALSVNNKTSKHIIDIISQVFNKIGYPSIIKCDNSPFNSADFARFANDFNIQFVYSSPRHPQSNGLAEKGVAIAKNILKRCFETNEVDQFQYRILEYNTTPIASLKLTPSELFFGRLVKTRLPVSGKLLCRNNLSEESIQIKINNKKEKQKFYYDRNAKSLPLLVIGDLVIFKKNGKEWHYGKIVGIVNDRSYIIKDSFDNHFRRNRRFIAKTMNEDFNASDLLFEENVKSSNIDNLPEIVIVQQKNMKRNVDANSKIVTADEPELPADGLLDGSNTLGSDSEYATAGSDDSEADLSSDNTVTQPVIQANYKTRSGRVVKPPQRYDW